MCRVYTTQELAHPFLLCAWCRNTECHLLTAATASVWQLEP
jgi:hypothetical protein